MTENLVAVDESAAPAQSNKFYGWRMVIVCGLIYAFVAALGLTIGQLSIAYMAADPTVTMDRTALGLGFTIYVLVQGLSAPIVGNLIAKFGQKLVYIIGSIIVAILGVIMFLFLGNSTWFYILFFGVFMSLGCFFGGQINAQSMMTNWFVVYRGRAMSIMMLITSVLATLYPIITNAVITSYGWRASWLIMTVCAVLGLILSFFIKNHPNDVGQVPDGPAKKAADDGAVEPKKRISYVYQRPVEDHYTLAQAIRTPAFWMIAVIALSCYFHLNLHVSTGALFFADKGLDLGTVAVGQSVMTATGIVLLLGLAFIMDRFEPVRVHGIGTLIGSIAVTLALFFGDQAWAMFVFYIGVAIAYGIQTVAQAADLGNYFGNTNYAKIAGTFLLIVACIACTIPTIAGALYDATGSYNIAFIIDIALGVVAFIVSLCFRYPKEWREEKAARKAQNK